MKPGKVCVIGAGAAGLATAHSLSRLGIPFDCFEAGSQLGGIWRYGNDSGSSVYASLITNTSQVNMEWFGHPMPARPNDFLTHQQVLEYLSDFAEQGNLRDRITFSSRVTSVEPEDDTFRVAVERDRGERLSRDYQAVVVATGCHSTPKWPKIPGIGNIERLHACDYRTSEIFESKKVVVVGFGASGGDIACDAANVARSVTLSTRSGGYLVPRYATNSRPRDENDVAWTAFLPRTVRKQLWRLTLLRRCLSPKVRAALERDAVPFAKPAVINDRLAALIDADAITVKPGIERFEGNQAIFSDGTSAESDLLVCATGYEPSYKFFSSEMSARNGSFLDRYLRVVPPNQPGLYFVGRISVVGPFFPILERQAMWVADLIAGECVLPPRAEMERLAARESRTASASYPDAGRREDTVEFYPYLRALNRELKVGRARRPRTERALADAVTALDPDFSS